MNDPLFAGPGDFLARFRDLPRPDAEARAAAAARNAVLTKPPGALGRLEELAIWLAGWQGTARPAILRPQIAVFAGNHGVVRRGVSAFPAAVTAQMVANFQAGGAAINRLAALAGANLDVVALDLDRPTADFTERAAMSAGELGSALAAGWAALRPEADLFVAGEMGIGNTTSAAAIAHALFGGRPEDWAGRGTGLDSEGVARKARAVAQGCARLAPRTLPLDILRELGGREIAAMAGAIAAARMARVPVILDGFIATAAAAVLAALVPGALDHVIAGHRSAEAAHGRLLDRLGLEPLLDLGLRLGEGSGAALAIQILRAAALCHSGMATFAEAAVSGRTPGAVNAADAG